MASDDLILIASQARGEVCIRHRWRHGSFILSELMQVTGKTAWRTIVT